ncbi:MAG TPA: ABC transporter ATP-binding protein [Erysipelothrix sp.]|jgi:ABC-2 type transport system ATP-binding protein|nr:ABC transporter ATP-binding protein [Erysipelothrix sp.]
MIQLTNLTKQFGDKVAVDDISITFPSGKIIGYIGPNGAGKTTTLKMMCGITKPSNGQILLNGIDIAKEPLAAKKQLGFVFDSPDAFLQLSGLEYINFIATIYEVDTVEKNRLIEELGEAFEMTDVLNDKIETYSHGMRQKIMIMAVLIHNPDIWLLDEPLTGLDPKSSFRLKEIMRAHADEGNTVLFSTHVLEVAEKLCDEIAIIDHGQIKYQGTLEALKQNYPDKSLEAIFLEVTK